MEESPSKEKIEHRIAELREVMQQVIQEEKFEDAAKLRDEIRTLESKLQRKGEEQA